jgi:hypothetical protein
LLRGQRLFEWRVLRGRALRRQWNNLPSPTDGNLLERSVWHLRRGQRSVLRELQLHGREYDLHCRNLRRVFDLHCLWWRRKSVLPGQFLFERRVLHRAAKWHRYSDMQGCWKHVQREHHLHLLGRRMRELRSPRGSVLREQPLHGAEYPVPDSHVRWDGKLRVVRRSQPALLRKPGHGIGGHLLRRLRVPDRDRDRRTSELRSLRRNRPALLRRRHGRHGKLPIGEHLSDADGKHQVLLRGLRRQRTGVLRRKHLRHRHVPKRHLSVAGELFLAAVDLDWPPTPPTVSSSLSRKSGTRGW